MKTLPLTKGQIAMVDDADFDSLNRFKWAAMKGKHTFYAVRGIKRKGYRKTILMHREILDVPKGMEGDHKDGNGLNNQRNNIRIASIAENRRNRIREQPNKSSKYRGVSWNTEHGIWVVNINFDKKHIHIGSFSDEIEAAKAYDAMAIKYFKEFASPNFPV